MRRGLGKRFTSHSIYKCVKVCTFLGDAAHDHGPEGDGEAVPRLASVVLFHSQELVNVEEDPASFS